MKTHHIALAAAFMAALAPTVATAANFLYQEPLEGVYFNEWFGEYSETNMLGDMIDVIITGEGKTVDFEGSFLADCQNGSISTWYYASNYGSGVDPFDVVPDAAFDQAYRQFCR